MSVGNLSTEIKPIHSHSWSTHEAHMIHRNANHLVYFHLIFLLFYHLNDVSSDNICKTHEQKYFCLIIQTKRHCSTAVCIPYIMIALQWNMIHRMNLAKCIVHYLICTYFPAIWYIISNKNQILGRFGHSNTQNPFWINALMVSFNLSISHFIFHFISNNCIDDNS